MYTDEVELSDFVLRVSRATLHTTRQRVHSPAGERAATKLVTPVTLGNVKPGQSATSSFNVLQMNRRIVAFCHKLLTALSITVRELTSGIVH
jgi:hypothetical protein